ncbi:MAG: hypothetical protein ABR603_05655 [Pyrinomonadaceae bacterium]
MFRFQRLLILVTLGVVSPILGLSVRAETLRFAWPDGASAKVSARSEGRRVGTGPDIRWNMSADFTMQVRRAGDRVVVSRNDFSGWKGTFPPSFGGGAERFTDMIPTFIVSADGSSFLGIEGHETARKLMNQSVEQSGGLDAASRSVFGNMTTDAALRAMASDFWSVMVGLWQDVELDPEARYELRNTTSVPQFGGGQLDITGEVGFVKETPCPSEGGAQRRCLHFHSETAADKEQVVKLVQALMQRAVAGSPVITGWDQRFKADIVVDKATALPQQLTLTRLHAIEASLQGRTERVSEEITKAYTFVWTLPGDGQKK